MPLLVCEKGKLCVLSVKRNQTLPAFLYFVFFFYLLQKILRCQTIVASYRQGIFVIFIPPTFICGLESIFSAHHLVLSMIVSQL